MAAMSLFFFFTHSHRPRHFSVAEVDDEDTVDTDANSVDAENGMKTVTFKMEHCDCLRFEMTRQSTHNTKRHSAL
jgi:hypothetical protein